MGIIYCAQNKVNGKRYIGQSLNPLKAKMKSYIAIARCQKLYGSRNPSLLTIAIWEFGEDAFEWTVLFDDVDKDELNQLEIDTIAVYKTIVPEGYNRMPGGRKGSKHSEETRKKMRESQRQHRIRSKETSKRRLQALRDSQSRRNPVTNCQSIFTKDAE